jgi:hypothetical protein
MTKAALRAAKSGAMDRRRDIIRDKRVGTFAIVKGGKKERKKKLMQIVFCKAYPPSLHYSRTEAN